MRYTNEQHKKLNVQVIQGIAAFTLGFGLLGYMFITSFVSPALILGVIQK